MKKVVFLLIVVLSLLPFNTHGAELKIGYVDLNKALNESDNGKKASKILEDMVKNKQAIIMEKENEIKKFREELEKQSSVLTPESRKAKEDQLNKLMRDGQRMVKDFQEELRQKEMEITQEIQKDLVKIVNETGKEEGYTVIFETGTSGILYSKKEFDITEKIIKKYNEITKTKK